MNFIFSEEIYKKPFIDEWPTVSFDEFENIKIEEGIVRVFYKSFFSILLLPQKIIHAFIAVLNYPKINPKLDN